MSCSPFDLKDFYLKELSDPQQRQVEAHVRDCAICQQELERLHLTQAALFSLRDEEIPQRIAFVSDPVFEPSRTRRWWVSFWGSPTRVGFAGAAMLSAALLFSTLARTSRPGSDVDRRIQQAIAASEARQTKTTTQLVHELVTRIDSERNMRLVAENDARIAKEQAWAIIKSSGAVVSSPNYSGESQ